MYTRLTRSRISVEPASTAYLVLGIFLNNYFAIYTRLTRPPIRVELASLTYLGLGIN